MIRRVVGESRDFSFAIADFRGISVWRGESFCALRNGPTDRFAAFKEECILMLQPKANKPAPASELTAPSASPHTRRHRSASGPTTLVVHSRLHAVRFRILIAPALTDVPVSFHPRHRTCQKAMDCNGDETSDRYQR